MEWLTPFFGAAVKNNNNSSFAKWCASDPALSEWCDTMAAVIIFCLAAAALFLAYMFFHALYNILEFVCSCFSEDVCAYRRNRKTGPPKLFAVLFYYAVVCMNSSSYQGNPDPLYGFNPHWANFYVHACVVFLCLCAVCVCCGYEAEPWMMFTMYTSIVMLTPMRVMLSDSMFGALLLVVVCFGVFA